MGVTTSFTGVAPIEGAISPGTIDSTTVSAFATASSVFILRTTAAINIAANLTISYIHGAQPSNIYWVAGAATTLGANTTIPGNFISGAAITTGALFTGTTSVRI